MAGRPPGNVTDLLEKYEQDKISAQRHANVYYYTLFTAAIIFLLTNVAHRFEMQWWNRRNNKNKQVDLGYDLGPEARDQHLRRSPIPLLSRLIRAHCAFTSKYLAEVRIPWINLSVGEALVIAVYLTVILWSLLITPITIQPESILPYPIRSFSNRAGILAFASLPFNVLLSSKVSFVGFLIGIPYHRLHYLHRWSCRCTLLLAITHASSKMAKIPIQSFTTSFMQYGFGAFVIACSILLFNQRWTMGFCYEFFVRVHNLMVLGLIILAWKHQPGHKNYLIASLLFWGLDRSYRYCRVIYHNGLFRMKASKTECTATLRLLSHDTTRLEVCKKDFTYWPPGSFAFISTPTLSWLPQSHPFSIASRPSRGQDRTRLKELDEFNNNSFSSPESTTENQLISSNANLVFLIRARKGWTKMLHNLAQANADIKVPVLVDGPYPSCPPLHIGFDTVILFAGGAGLSWTLPLLTDLVERGRNGKSAVRHITWVCVLRHYVNYDWFYNELESIDASPYLDIRIHFTTDAEDANLIPQHFHPGRPNIQSIIQNAVDRSLGRTFVGVSGPLGPSDEVRRQCRLITSPLAILQGDTRGDIHFHSELFGW